MAIVHLNGFLAKYPSWLFYFVRGTSTLDFAEAVSAAARDTLVKSIVLIVDSGGGEVAGAFQAAQAVYDARKKMRVVAVTSDLNASSAFLISSQANEVVINESGFLGSIGVYAILADYSGMYERAGIKVNVVRADGADFKGIGEPGSEITPAQLAEVKRRVEQTHNLFLRHVARGRNLPVDRVRALATGQAFGSSEAIRNKLADRVVSDPESVITELDRPFAEQLAKM
ncbi:MAG: S49 family peptidase [Planctomycetes bacterium]|nr:S49 family peptidase [Planctomycetota bacterium]